MSNQKYFLKMSKVVLAIESMNSQKKKTAVKTHAYPTKNHQWNKKNVYWQKLDGKGENGKKITWFFLSISGKTGQG